MSLDGFEMESNVGRDVLSTASSFGSVPKVVAEYVTNSIDARDEGQAVNVTITKRRAYNHTRIVVTDDARGMDGEDLRRFFYMHAENEARRRGRTTRGRFGTGKAAAFGIGTSLQVETCRGGKKWVVRLEKAELEEAVKDKRKPKPEVLEDGSPTTEPNGTSIIIDGLDKATDEKKIISELQRRLGRHLDVHSVSVFGTKATIVEPAAKRTWLFDSKDDATIATVIGPDVTCKISAAAVTPVDEGIRGIIVTAHDFPVAQINTLGDYATRLFGRCDVPALEQDNSTPGPYTDTRDLTLNESNATAGPLATWLRECLAEVVGELAADERDQRRRAQDAALRNAATRMEAVLNRHYQGEFRRTRTQQGDAGSRTITVTPDEEGELVRTGAGFAGYEIPPSQPRLGDPPAPPTPAKDPPVEPTPQVRDRDPFGEGRGEPVTSPEEPKPRRSRGGFKIDFHNAGEDATRCTYLESQLTILVNLDHPELAAAHKDGDTPLFRMLAFEAAAQEYAYATAYQRLEEDHSLDASDILQYVRGTLEILTRDVSDVIADLAISPKLAIA
jgi:hypothetical protein